MKIDGEIKDEQGGRGSSCNFKSKKKIISCKDGKAAA